MSAKGNLNYVPIQNIEGEVDDRVINIRENVSIAPSFPGASSINQTMGESVFVGEIPPIEFGETLTESVDLPTPETETETLTESVIVQVT